MTGSPRKKGTLALSHRYGALLVRSRSVPGSPCHLLINVWRIPQHVSCQNICTKDELLLGSPFSSLRPPLLLLPPGSIYVASYPPPNASSATFPSASSLWLLSVLCPLGFSRICLVLSGIISKEPTCSLFSLTFDLKPALWTNTFFSASLLQLQPGGRRS